MALTRIKFCLVFIFSVISRVSALSCMPCNPSSCMSNMAVGCTAGITKDVCGCCNVCAKAEGEHCGGPWDISGTCGDGLKCEKPNLPGNDFNADGTCVLENPINLPFIFNGFNLTGFGGLGLSGFSGSSFTFNNGITNFNGINLGVGDICIKACILNYLPVCGSDQKTYPNQCSLENAQCTNNGLTFMQKGICGSQPPVTPIYCYKAMCTRDYRPVCGNDGQTYSNDCELNNAKCDKKALSKVHNGPCVKTIMPACKTRHCPLMHKPICGSDGETYGNQCLFANAMCDTVTLASVQPGPCSSACNVCYGNTLHNNGFDLSGFAGITLSGFGGHTFSLFNGINLYNGLNLAGSSCYTICTAIYLPVCGSDQKTYPNECSLENAKCDNPFLTKYYTGKCGEVQYPESTTCIKATCNAHGFPICGSDGVTYTCLCAFNNARCGNSFLQITSYGTCVVIEIPVICKTPYCTLIYKPVCGSDGNTYGNDCIFKNAKCDDVFLTKVGDGACDNCKSEFCTLEYFSICGSDGKTYGNECFFNNAKCDNPLLTKKHNGGCEETTMVCSRKFCFEIYRPVCGSDGKTYSNECYLSNAKCENNFLSIAYQGVCEILWRFDFRCGRKYTLASGRPAQCNPNSPTAFCCSASGWCGHSDFHCDCRDCTNYKKFSLDNLLLSSVTRLQTTCGHTNDCQSTLQSLQQFVSLQRQHIELLNHNGDLMKSRLGTLEQQTTGSLGKLHYLVALHYGCQHPFRFLEGTEECFYFHSERMTYTEAKRACIMQSAEIAKPDNFKLFTQFTSRTSSSSSFSVTSTMGSDIFDILEQQPFIGAQLGASGKFTWEDKTEVDLDNWQKKLKDPLKPSCGVYCPSCAYTNVPIDLSDCNKKRPFICKKRKGVTNGITSGITGGIPNVGPTNTVITNTGGGDLNSQLLANLLQSIQQNG